MVLVVNPIYSVGFRIVTGDARVINFPFSQLLSVYDASTVTDFIFIDKLHFCINLPVLNFFTCCLSESNFTS